MREGFKKFNLIWFDKNATEQDKNNFNDDGNYTPNYKFFNKTKLLYCWDFRSQNYRNSWKDSLGVIRDIENNTNAEIKTHGITTSTHERRDDGIHLNNDDYNNITNPGGVYIDLVGIDDSTYISDAFTIEIVAKFDSNQRIGHNGINSGNLFDFSNEDGDNRIYSKRGDTNKKLELVINDTTNINVTTETKEDVIDISGFQQYVYTINMDEIKLYVNGVNKFINSDINLPIHLKNIIRKYYLLGTNYELNGDSYFRGVIKSLRIYKGTKSFGKIYETWNGGEVIKDPKIWKELEICPGNENNEFKPFAFANKGFSSKRSLNVRVFFQGNLV